MGFFPVNHAKDFSSALFKTKRTMFASVERNAQCQLQQERSAQLAGSIMAHCFNNMKHNAAFGLLPHHS